MSLPIIDFHCHHVPACFALTVVQNAPPSQKSRWAATAKLINDESLLLADIDAGDIDARVINTPTAHICDAAGHVPHDTIRRVNDELAAIQHRHPGRIHALATVEAYDGDRAARELERAITTLGLKGVFVECAKGDLLIDAPEARPTLEVAAKLGVPVFVHPVNPEPMLSRMEPYGRLGTLLARGTVNSQALIALLEGGTFVSLPELKVVVTALAFGGLAMAAGFSGNSKLEGGTHRHLRRNVFIDTMELDPVMMRAAVDIVGRDNVLIGSDWPIVSEGPIRARVEETLEKCALAPADRTAIASGNSTRLLRL
jgi:predicted TIM-barrel fold metal-dependent hydrolase